MLDYLTLYVIILMNSLTVSVIWAAIVYSYRAFRPARFWLSASVLTMAGGVILALLANSGSVLPILAANAAVIFGFYLFWSGIRVFYGMDSRWRTGLLLTAATIAVAAAAQDNLYWRGIAYAAGQSVPMALSAIRLFAGRRPRLGAIIAGVAMLTGMAGHATMIVIDLLWLSGYPQQGLIIILPSYTLLAVIFSGTVWNFGFAIMAIDRLRAEVASLAGIDELTGVANLRRLRERMREEDARARRTGRPYSIIMADMDRLKQINDRHGHAAGDAAIISVAHALRDALRQNDLLARIGGDEFCILLPDTNLLEAQSLADRISHAVRRRSEIDNPVPDGMGPTVSLGIAEWNREKSFSAKDVMRCADEALYGVKARRPTEIGLSARSAIRPGGARIAV